jgi:WD40 repeat protein
MIPMCMLAPALTLAAASVVVGPRTNVVWVAQEANAVTTFDTIAYSPDGLLLADGRTDSNSVLLRDAATGEIVETLAGTRNNARALAFSPDSRLLATGTGTSGQQLSLGLWSVPDATRLVSRIAAHRNGTIGVSFAPDGQTVATCGFQDHVIRLWHVPDMTLVREIDDADASLGYSLRVTAVAFSPDGSLLASADDRGVQLRRTTDFTVVQTLHEGDGVNISSLAFSPNSATIAAGVMHLDSTYGTCESCVVRQWRVSDGLELHTFTADTPDMFYPKIGFSPDGKLLAAGFETGQPGSETGNIHFWRVADGATITIDRQTSSVHAFAYSPDGATYAYMLADGRVAVAGAPKAKRRPARSQQAR